MRIRNACSAQIVYRCFALDRALHPKNKKNFKEPKFPDGWIERKKAVCSFYEKSKHEIQCRYSNGLSWCNHPQAIELATQSASIKTQAKKLSRIAPKHKRGPIWD